MNLIRTAAVAAAAALALTACSAKDTPAAAGNAKAEQQSAEQASRAALEESVRSYTAALFAGNADGYDYVSERCRKQMSRAEFVSMAKDAHHQYGPQKATGVKVDQLAGDLARVSYGAGKIPQFEREQQSWTREDETWRWDACPSTQEQP